MATTLGGRLRSRGALRRRFWGGFVTVFVVVICSVFGALSAAFRVAGDGVPHVARGVVEEGVAGPPVGPFGR